MPPAHDRDVLRVETLPMPSPGGSGSKGVPN
jgi:hypothetical protein